MDHGIGSYPDPWNSSATTVTKHFISRFVVLLFGVTVVANYKDFDNKQGGEGQNMRERETWRLSCQANWQKTSLRSRRLIQIKLLLQNLSLKMVFSCRVAMRVITIPTREVKQTGKESKENVWSEWATLCVTTPWKKGVVWLACCGQNFLWGRAECVWPLVIFMSERFQKPHKTYTHRQCRDITGTCRQEYRCMSHLSFKAGCSPMVWLAKAWKIRHSISLEKGLEKVWMYGIGHPHTPPPLSRDHRHTWRNHYEWSAQYAWASTQGHDCAQKQDSRRNIRRNECIPCENLSPNSLRQTSLSILISREFLRHVH